MNARWPKQGMVAALAAGSFVVMLAGCGKSGDPAMQSSEVTVITVAVDSAVMATPVQASGLLAGKEEVPMAFKIGGVVAHLDAEAGQSVRAGQRLASLEQPEIGAAVDKAEAGLEKAERDWARARALYADSVITRELFDNAGTARRVAQSDLRAARFNERYASIVAPAAGTVLRRLAEPGQTVAPGMPIVVFSADGRGQVVRAGLADRDAARLAVGDSAAVTFGALPGESRRGRLARIGAAASPGAGTYEVEITLREPVRIVAGGAPASGLVADVTLYPSRRAAVKLVPMTALLEGDGDRAGVWTIAPGGTAERREVRIAYLDGDRAAIASGLEGVTRVVADGAAYLSPGSRVREAVR